MATAPKYPPEPQPIADKNNAFKVGREWLAFFRDLLTQAAAAGNVTGTSTAVTSGAPSQLLGRGSSGGPGPWQPITLNGGLKMTGTVLSATAVGAYVPVATGEEPLKIMSNGSGSVLVVPFTPDH